MFSESIIIPFIIALIELLKGFGLPKKYAGLFALLFGALIGVFYLNNASFKERLFMGAVYGLSAAGLYSGTKNTIEARKDRIRRNNSR